MSISNNIFHLYSYGTNLQSALDIYTSQCSIPDQDYRDFGGFPDFKMNLL